MLWNVNKGYESFCSFSQVKRRDVTLGTEQVGCVNLLNYVLIKKFDKHEFAETVASDMDVLLILWLFFKWIMEMVLSGTWYGCSIDLDHNIMQDIRKSLRGREPSDVVVSLTLCSVLDYMWSRVWCGCSADLRDQTRRKVKTERNFKRKKENDDPADRPGIVFMQMKLRLFWFCAVGTDDQRVRTRQCPRMGSPEKGEKEAGKENCLPSQYLLTEENLKTGCKKKGKKAQRLRGFTDVVVSLKWARTHRLEFGECGEWRARRGR